jgi:hypothetical protein
MITRASVSRPQILRSKPAGRAPYVRGRNFTNPGPMRFHGVSPDATGHINVERIRPRLTVQTNQITDRPNEALGPD